MNKFSRFVVGTPQCKPALPLTHTCDGFRFGGITQSSEISTNLCPVFGEQLIYLFYGRPAYRPSSWKDESAKSSYPFMPCSIVLNSNAVSAPKRIAPFDTGAWKEGLYSKHLHPAVRMEDFLLDPSLDMPPRLVKKFFRSNSNYYLGNPISIKIPPMEFEAQMYYEIIKTRATKSLDDRGSAIEIQSDSSLILNMANVLFVVLPKVFLDQKDIRDIINKKWGASFGTYDIHQGNVEEMMGKVYERVQEYLSKGGYL